MSMITFTDADGVSRSVSADAPLPVEISESINLTMGSEVEIKNESGNPIPTSVAPRTPTTTSVASSATSVEILAANADRRGFSISNISTAKLYLSFSSPASQSNCFIEVPGGAFLLLDQQLIVGSAIYGVWATENGTAQVTEFV